MANPFAHKKLFGPFNGLNGPLSPLRRELPPAPNAKSLEYATEFKNFIIDKDTASLISRNGIEFTDTDAPASAAQSRLTSGIFKWTDYDSVTGVGRERGVQISVDQAGVATVYAYRRIKTEVTLSGATYSGKSLGIIEDPDNSYAKRFIIYNADGSVNSTYTTLASIPNVTVSYYDWDTNRDGSILTSAVDLLIPTSLGSTSTVSSVPFYSLARKVTISAQLNLSSWLTNAITADGAFFTAAEASNVIYFSGGGVGALLKYDGQTIYKASMPNAGIKGSIDRARASVATFEAAAGRSIQSDSGGLMGLAAGAGDDLGSPLGRFVYMAAYERGDAKNGYIEGKSYLPGTYATEDSTGSPVLSTQVKPAFSYLSGLDRLASVVSGNIFQYSAKSLRATDAFDARGALLHTMSGTYSQSGTTTVTVTLNGHGFVNGQSIAVNITSGTGVDGSYTVTGATTNTFTYTAGGSLTTSGSVFVSRIVTAANVASNFSLITDGTNNTLLAGDVVCIRATLLMASGTAHTSLDRLPILITATLASITSTSVTFDVSKPILIELVNGGDALANGTGGYASNLTTDSSQALQTTLTSITTWANLLAFTWLGKTANSRLNFTTDYAISNNLRINIYRNKANDTEGNSYDPDAADGTFIPTFYLLNILPNNPFNANTAMGTLTYENCLDASLGAVFVPKETLILEDKDQTDLTATDYSPLPKGRGLSSFKGRLYLTDDPKNQNIVWRSDTLYGTEWFRAEDALNVETPAGDSASICVGNDNVVFVLKTNGIKSIISDLNNDEIRLDDTVVGKYGCIAPRSAKQLNTGIAYLSPEGPVFLEADKQIGYLGENINGVSRIKDRLATTSSGIALDLKRAVASVDETKGHYNLYIPQIEIASAGLDNNRDFPGDGYTGMGVFFVYDYNNDAWTEYTNVNAKGGMCMIDGQMFFMSAYAHYFGYGSQTAQWALYKERNYGNLFAYADYLSIGNPGTLTFSAIPCSYATDWLAFEDANILKQFLRTKAYGLSTFPTISFKSSGGTAYSYTGDYTLTVKSYKDWRGDTIQSQSSIDLTSTNLNDYAKCRNNKSEVMKFKYEHAVLRKSPKIQAFEVEIAAPYRPKMKRWGTP